MVINVRRPLCFISYEHVDGWRWPLSMFSSLTFHTVTGKTRHVGEDVHLLHQDQWSHILSRRSGSLLLRIVGNESLAMLMFMGEELNWSFQYVRTCRWTSVCASAIKPSICCTVTLHFRRYATSLKLPVVFHIGFTHQPFKLSHFFNSCLLFL